MRVLFLASLLAASLLYSYYAYDTLPFLTTTGRLGAGFFPRVIGTLLVLMCLFTLLSDGRSRTDAGAGRSATHAGSVAVLVSVTLGYLAALRLVGGVAATVMFLVVVLSIFNRGQHLLNATVSFVVPACIYLLFAVTLKADLPEGILQLPF